MLSRCRQQYNTLFLVGDKATTPRITIQHLKRLNPKDYPRCKGSGKPQGNKR